MTPLTKIKQCAGVIAEFANLLRKRRRRHGDGAIIASST